MISDAMLLDAVRARHGAARGALRLLSRRRMRGSYGGSGARFESVRLEIDGREERAVLKCMAPDPVSRPVERRFYEELASRVRMRIPRVLALGDAPDSEHGWVLLEAFGPLLQRAFWRPAQLRAIVGELAKLHADFLDCPPGWPKRPLTDDLPDFVAHVEPGVERLRELQERFPVLRPLAAPPALEVALALARDPTRLRDALAASPQTLIHRDFHQGNIAVPLRARDAPITFDWEDASVGPPIFDLTLFHQYLGLTWLEWPALRLEWTRFGPPALAWPALLELYLDALARECRKPIDRTAIANASDAAFVWESLYRIGWVHGRLARQERWLGLWSSRVPALSRYAAFRAEEAVLRAWAGMFADLACRGAQFL